MSLNGLQSSQFPLTLDGTSSLDVSSLTIGGQTVDLSNLVPYTGANQTVDLGSQIVKTTHTATTNPELVNLGLLNTTISTLAISIAGSFLDKVTVTPQTVIGNVSYSAQLSSDDLLVLLFKNGFALPGNHRLVYRSFSPNDFSIYRNPVSLIHLKEISLLNGV